MPANNNVQRFRDFVDPLGEQFTEDFFIYEVNQPSLAPGVSVQLPINIQADSAFEWLFTTATGSTATTGSNNDNWNVNVLVIDQTSARNLASAAMPLLHFGGSGQLPFILPIPRRFMSKTTLSVVLTNFDTAATLLNVRIQLVGRKIFSNRGNLQPNQNPQLQRFRQWESVDPLSGQKRLLCEDLFAYVIQIPNTLATASSTVSQLIEADSDFEWISTTFTANQNLTVNPIGANAFLSTLQITDGGSQRQLFNQAIAMNALDGKATLPFILPVPRIFMAKSAVKLDFTLTDTAMNLVNIIFTMWGRKIFELN